MTKKLTKIKKKYSSGESNLIITIVKVLSIALVILFEIILLYVLFLFSKDFYATYNIVQYVIRVVAIIYLLNRHDDVAYKISWILFIMFMPILGGSIYVLWGNGRLRKDELQNLKDINSKTEGYLRDLELNFNDGIFDLLENESIDKSRYTQARYISNVSGFPLNRNKFIKYFDLGDHFFKSLLIDLKKAKKYIPIQSYIVSSGKLLSEITEILKNKVKEGVKVVLVFDSIGSALTKPKDFIEKYSQMGIEIHEFNPLSPVISSYINCRDHRKYIVIDGVISYVGGVNIADEYANIKHKHGHWKDSGIAIYKEAAFTYLIMFLRMLEHVKKEEVDYDWYVNIRNDMLKEDYYDDVEKADFASKDGYIMSFSDGPDNRKNPYENIYLQMINYAKEYIYITTPYLAISEQMLTALLNSARSGVHVKILVPSIPDKKIVNIVTKSYYEVLLEAGIKIYEYTPGFMHSKSFVSDDDVAIIGTANLDYFSLHLNFECGTWLYKTGVEEKIRDDYLYTLENCKEIKLEKWKKRSVVQKLLEVLLKVFAPMM